METLRKLRELEREAILNLNYSYISSKELRFCMHLLILNVTASGDSKRVNYRSGIISGIISRYITL